MKAKLRERVRNHRCYNPVTLCLRRVSVGQHSTKLYFSGQAQNSSVCGGLLTLACAVLLIVYIIIVLA